MDKIDDKIFELIDILKSQGVVPSDYQFALKINKPAQHINNVRNYKNRHFTLKDVDIIIQVFNVNPNWIFDLDNEVFRNEMTSANSFK